MKNQAEFIFDKFKSATNQIFKHYTNRYLFLLWKLSNNELVTQYKTTGGMIKSEIQIKDSTFENIAEIASKSLYPRQESKIFLSVTDVSGNSGAKTYLCNEGDVPKCIVKITNSDSIMNSHPNTTKRVTAATKIMREHGIAPPILYATS